ncbi:uncharacterized protein [Narcine bancroftii]|uniref:uncharacterized protein n=1 Tax=Narcine bancroftii TaxID=1343680 RepID=UPI003831BF25
MDPELAQESGRVNVEEDASAFSKGDEFLSHLTQEEKECLGFLIETIDALEVDLEEEEKEGATKGDGAIGDGFYEFLGMVYTTRPAKESGDPGAGDDVGIIGQVDAVGSSTGAEMANARGMVSVPGLGPTPNRAATTEGDAKQKCQGSEATIGLEFNTASQPVSDEQSTPRSLTLLPAHARKFDTILRSGVSVQELRAQVLARLSGSAQKKPSGQVEGLVAQSDSLRLLGTPEQRAARQDALQRLGLWKFTGGAASRNDTACTQPLAAEKAQKPSSQSPTEEDHEAALKKLGLLNL